MDAYRGETKDGKPIFNEQDDWSQQRWKQIKHVWGAFEPGTITSINKTIKKIKGDEDKSFDGTTTTDIPKSFTHLMRRRRSEDGDAKDLLTKILKKDDLTDADIRKAYDKMEKRRIAIFEETRKDVVAAQIMGLNQFRIKSLIRASGYSAEDAIEIMAGKYTPFVPTDEFLNKAIKLNKALLKDTKEIVRRKRLVKTISLGG